eukprot:1161948-Pelagomonas_calceolata.AAC.11
MQERIRMHPAQRSQKKVKKGALQRMQRVPWVTNKRLRAVLAGRSVESWLLKNIDRNNFPPNLGGVRMWQAERRKWQANRLTSIMKEAECWVLVCTWDHKL